MEQKKNLPHTWSLWAGEKTNNLFQLFSSTEDESQFVGIHFEFEFVPKL